MSHTIRYVIQVKQQCHTNKSNIWGNWGKEIKRLQLWYRTPSVKKRQIVCTSKIMFFCPETSLPFQWCFRTTRQESANTANRLMPRKHGKVKCWGSSLLLRQLARMVHHRPPRTKAQKGFRLGCPPTWAGGSSHQHSWHYSKCLRSQACPLCIDRESETRSRR